MKFASLSRAEKILLFKTLWLVTVIRIGLFVLPFSALRRMAAKAREKSGAPHYSVDRIVWAVRATSRYVPRATCLTQALAGQKLLAESGHRSFIKIGVAKDEQLRFQSHAWVICGERIVLGGPEVDRYASLLTWEKG